jgi:hypothetical protein
MNVTFHVLTAMAASAALSPSQAAAGAGRAVAGLAAGIALHGVLDLVPHSYPIRSGADAALGAFLIAAAVAAARPGVRLLVAACCLGAILPDVLDLAPGILHRHLGLSLPEPHLFPWHWRRYSGSVYDGSRGTATLAAHLTVFTVVALLAPRYADRVYPRARTPR